MKKVNILVLSSYGPFAPWWGDIDTFFEKAVKPSGYEYFTWNGLLYRYDKHGTESYMRVKTVEIDD